MEEIVLKVKADTSEAEKSIENIKDAIEDVGNSSATGKVADSMGKVKEAVEDTTTEFLKQKALLIAYTSKYELLKEKLSDFKAQMVLAVSEGMVPNAMSLREKILRTEEALRKMDVAYEQVASDEEHSINATKLLDAQYLSTASDLEILEYKYWQLKAAMEAAIQKGDTDKVASLRKQIASTEKEIAKLSQTTEKAGKTAEKSQGGFSKLLTSIGRIAFYRAVRGIIKSITQALQEGTQNAYFFSQGIGGTMAEALDAMATKAQTLKNQLGAAFGTLLEAAMPVILKVIEWTTKLLNVVTELFAALSGKSTYLKAVDVSKQWAENTDKASKSAKELKRTLMGFDVINKLNDDSSGSGSSENANDPSKMFEVAQVGSEIKSVANWIRQAFTDVLGWVRQACIDVTGWVSQAVKDVVGWVVQAWEDIKGFFSTIAGWIDSNVIQPVVGLFRTLWAIVKAIAITAWNWFNEAIWKPLVAWAEPILKAVGKFVGQVWSIFTSILGQINEWLETNIWSPIREAAVALWEVIKQIVAAGINLIISSFESRINSIIGVINFFIRKVNSIASWAGKITGDKVQIFGELSYVSLPKVSFANGGFPEDGLFFANHTELVGQFSNGKTAVANNEQIVAGIKQGVYEAMVSANGNSRTQSAELNIDGITLARALFKYNNQVSNEHGTSLVMA